MSADGGERLDTHSEDGVDLTLIRWMLSLTGDSGEAERFFRREAERHSGMIPNTIGA